jgi:broad specificity phosphatase PhoE
LPPSEKGNCGYLVLARHGNTFEPGQKVVWVGSSNDLALSKRGIEQAGELADACLENGITFDTIMCGPLKRTKEYGRIVQESLKTKRELVIDPRLDEIDYGSWSGLSDEEVIERFGENNFNLWNNFGIWPAACDWGGTPERMLDEIKDFLSAQAHHLLSGKNVLAVTSNGRLKFFHAIVCASPNNAHFKDTPKVKTGNLCVFAIGPETREYRCESWNLAPRTALQALVISVSQS